MSELKKILVTGGTGYVGSVLVPMLLDAGYMIRVVGTKEKYEIDFLDFSNTNLEYVQADLTKEDDVLNVLKDIDMVIHMASMVGENICREKPELAYDINVGITEKLNRLRNSKSIIFVSSSSVYGIQDRSECDETTPVEVAKELVYASTKYEGEKIIINSNNYIVLRPASFFGYAPKMNYNSLINNFVKEVLGKKKLEIYDNGLMRTFVHVSDMARLIVYMTDNFQKYNKEIYNVGNDNMNATKINIANIIKDYLDYELIDTSGSSDPDKRDFIVNYNKLNNTGFKFEYSLKSGIKYLIERIK